MDSPGHMITLKGISVGYQQEHPLVSKVDLSAGAGEMIALVGRNGTGKSTLLRSVLGLVPFLEGECLVGEVPFIKYDVKRRAKLISFVSTGFAGIPSITVRELVSLGRMPHTGWWGRLEEKEKQQVERAIVEVGMIQHAERQVDQLSDGERQRVMIARAFVQDTPVILLDEPAAYLDIPNKYELIRILSQFRDGGKTIIFSTHDLETAMMYADKFWVIEGGKIHEGAPEDLGLTGLFGRLFQTSGISFDAETTRFRIESSARGTIRLYGEPGSALQWTMHAMQRLGFEVSGKEGSVSVEVTTDAQGPAWRVSGQNRSEIFTSLYKLARFLTQEG